MSDNNFTPNSIVDAIEIDDNMVDFIGFIDDIKGKSIARNKAYVARVVLNNGSGKRVQVVAWGKFIPKLEEVSVFESIIQLEGAVSKFAVPSSKYNAGNVSFQLEIKEHTQIKRIGIFNRPLLQNQIKLCNFDNITVDSIIRIEGYVKNGFRNLITKYQNILIESITNGEKKLEIHILEVPDKTKSNANDLINFDMIHKGSKVSITGQIIKRRESVFLNTLHM